MSDRKYGHRGYQDSERGERREAPRPPTERREGPRGRGLGAPTEPVFVCRVCTTRQAPPAADAFAATCPSCGNAVHTCTHCTFFDPATFRECRQTIPERVAKKDKANQCTLFEAKIVMERAKDAPAPGDARAAFDALFKL